MEILFYVGWYIIGLLILGIFFYKVESCASTIEILGMLFVSVLGPLSICIPIIYFIDTYGTNKIFKWRD